MFTGHLVCIRTEILQEVTKSHVSRGVYFHVVVHTVCSQRERNPTRYKNSLILICGTAHVYSILSTCLVRGHGGLKTMPHFRPRLL